MATEASRKDIIDCLYDWQLSYKITGNYAVIDTCIAELVGEKKLNWFNYSELNEFDNNDACNQLSFDAKTFLINLLTIKNSTDTYSWESIRGRVFSSLSNSFTNELNEILKETDPSVKRDKLILFIKKCEKCYSASGNLAFIARAKEAKKADLELNDLIQAKAYKEANYFGHAELDKISDNFINSIVDQKVIINTPPPYEVAEALAKESNLKTWYLAFSIVFILGSGILCYQFYGEVSFLRLELLFVLSIVNLIGCLYFNFLYKKATNI